MTMATKDVASADEGAAGWGAREVAAAALITLVVSTVLGSLLLTVIGDEAGEAASLLSVAFLQTTLWAGMATGVFVALRHRRGAIVQRLGLRFRLSDVPIGVALGVASQLAIVPLVSWPWAGLLGRSTDDLREPACRLAEKADDPLGVIILFAITVLGAPVVEELFFRGFVQRGMTSSFGRVAGVVSTAAIFGTIHYQLLQLPALVAFGLVLGIAASRTGRLGLSIVTHAAFNATTIVTLVLLSSSVGDSCASTLAVVR